MHPLRSTFPLFLALFTLGIVAHVAAAPPFLPEVRTVSTVPPNGDLNPYGVAFVPHGVSAGGHLTPGDILVSNFNNKQNQQGTGTTIIRVRPTGTPSVFYEAPIGHGLTTALVVLREGFVLVGNLPTADGTCATARAGSILVLDKHGHLINTITSPLIDGPWDAALHENGTTAHLFVSNALTGTVSRLDLHVSATNVTLQHAVPVASGYAHRCDPAALVVGPTGLVYDHKTNQLFVASTADNAIFVVAGAGTTTMDLGKGALVYMDPTHLHGPLALVRAPNGDFLVSNSDVVNSDPAQPSEIVEFTREGQFRRQLSVDLNQGGSFGLNVHRVFSTETVQFAAVDDNANTLTIWTLPMPEGEFFEHREERGR